VILDTRMQTVQSKANMSDKISTIEYPYIASTIIVTSTPPRIHELGAICKKKIICDRMLVIKNVSHKYIQTYCSAMLS